MILKYIARAITREALTRLVGNWHGVFVNMNHNFKYKIAPKIFYSLLTPN